MNIRLIPLLVLLCLIPLPAFALDAHLDRTDYMRGDQVTITGNIVPANGTEMISIWILQKNTWYDRATLEVDGTTFNHTFTITDAWQNDGTYVARVDYNGEEFKVPFTVSTPTPVIVTPPAVEVPEQTPPPTPPEEPVIESFENATVTTSNVTSVEPVINDTITEPIIEPEVSEPIINETATEPIVNATTPEIDAMTSPEIPAWIKGVFVYWANGQISDSELIEAIKFLVNTGVLVL